jgi:hypothetical protein
MATVIMVVTNRPGNKEFDWLRALAVRQQAALSTPQDVVS